MKVCLVGYGKLGSSIAKGLRAAGVEVSVSTLPPTDEAARSDGFRVMPLRGCASSSDLVVVAVPPSSVLSVAEALSTMDVPVVSTAAMVGLDSLRKYLKNAYRVMPSVTVEVRSSPILLAEKGWEHDSLVEEAFSKLGTVHWVDEGTLDAALPVVGSGPALHSDYYRSLVEALVMAGVERSLAEKLARESIEGAMKMLEKLDPYELRSKVETPGGITVEMMVELEKEGVFGKIAKVLGAMGRKLKRR